MELEQLKATAYDTLVRIEQLQVELRKINQQIQQSSSVAPKKEEKK